MITTKLKSGTPYTLNNQNVWLHHDKCDGTATIRYCQSKYDAEKIDIVRVEDLKGVVRVGKGIIAKPKKLTLQENGFKDDLNDFFILVSQDMPFNCQCCGKPLYALKTFAKRCVTAHILPKAEFPSLATNIYNIFFLGAGIIGVCFCHDTWDGKGAKHRTTMACYPLAIYNFNNYLKQELNERDYIKACKYLDIVA